MEKYSLELFETAIVILSYLILRYVLFRTINKAALKYVYQAGRVTVIKRLIRLLLFFIGVISVLFIWGVNQSELFVFMASVLTVIGIALFAQWSHLSNLTSGIITFFNHAV